jgi:hypothetical protein
VATLIDLNPQIRTWYLLRLETPDGRSATYHLENPNGARLRLDRSGIVMEREASDSNEGFLCELWPAGTALPLAEARDSRLAYAPSAAACSTCGTPSKATGRPRERVVDLLRDHVWQGEEITILVRDLFYRDAYLATSDLAAAPVMAPAPSQRSGSAFGRPPLRSAAGAGRPGDRPRRRERPVAVGRWYPCQDNPGIFVTTLRPDLVSPEIIEDQKGRVAALDPVESAALVYLVAFDLEQFDLGFRLGTDHPRVGWSDWSVPAVRDDALAGPDGIETTEPLVRTGMLGPLEQSRVAATFTGGFKRARRFQSIRPVPDRPRSHYGFVENSVV